MTGVTDPVHSDAAGSTIMFRAPSTVGAKPAASFTNPTREFLQRQWQVTHSSLPMWKSKRNVSITYTFLDSPPGAIDDLVQSQPLDSNKIKKVRGIDTPDSQTPAKYTWRGRGWLKIASSNWEILGFGEEAGGWVVTYFSKTLFTPAGIDVYASTKDALPESLVDMIKTEIRRVDDRDFNGIADQIFKIQHD